MKLMSCARCDGFVPPLASVPHCPARVSAGAMKQRVSLLSLALVSVLMACPTSTGANGLCAAAQVAAICGIPDDECQAVLATDPAFDASSLYIPPQEADVVGGECVLSASSLGRPIRDLRRR